MSGDLPELYFRVRDKGAVVFQVETGTRNRRIELEQIATCTLHSGEIRPAKGRKLPEAVLQQIRNWIAERNSVLQARRMDDIHRTVEALNHATIWAGVNASDAQLEEITDPLLLAMHDLRATLIRKKAIRARHAAQDTAAAEVSPATAVIQTPSPEKPS